MATQAGGEGGGGSGGTGAESAAQQRPAAASLPPPLIIVSGGLGNSAAEMVRTVLAQFPGRDVPLAIKACVRSAEQLAPILEQAAASGATVVHTMVERSMRDALVEGARARGVVEVDLSSALIDRLRQVLGVEALGQPGRYRELRQDYFDRVAAIEFTVAQDDGLRPEGWAAADLVLVGLSRVGKTPLSMYLAVHGWKVANVPLTPELPLPAELAPLERRRLFGLEIDHERLLEHRRHRQRELGLGAGRYAEARAVFAEVQWAHDTLRRLCASTHDVGGKPIETLASEIVWQLQSRFGAAARR